MWLFLPLLIMKYNTVELVLLLLMSNLIYIITFISYQGHAVIVVEIYHPSPLRGLTPLRGLIFCWDNFYEKDLGDLQFIWNLLQIPAPESKNSTL